MKRLIALLVLLLLGFYVVWPAWTGYQIATALKSKDSVTLESKIVFADVRQTLKPAAVQKIGEVYDTSASQIAGGAGILNQIKKDVVPKIAETAINQLVTAGNLIRVVSEGGTLKESAERILREQIGKAGLPGLSGIPGLGGAGGSAGGGQLPGGLNVPGGLNLPGGLGQIAGKIPGLGGLGGGGAPRGEAPPAAPAQSSPSATASAPPAGYGIGNIKRFSFLGPLGFEVGVAKDATAAEADVVVEMRFVNGDWRVTGVKPRV